MTGNRRPLIGVTGRRKRAAQVEGFPGPMADFDVDVYVADYGRSILDAGGVPVHLPIDADPADYLPSLQGVLLTGGADVEPGRYGQEPDGNGLYEPVRDELELALLELALELDLPVLGICRGLQVINVYAGGTLCQDVPPHARYDVPAHRRIHRVHFEPESRLALLYRGLFGADDGEPLAVNSLHHQTVDRLGEGLRIAARDDDGVVEGVELPGHDLLAVQWHPEMLREPEPVFDWLIAQAANRLRGPVTT